MVTFRHDVIAIETRYIQLPAYRMDRFTEMPHFVFIEEFPYYNFSSRTVIDVHIDHFEYIFSNTH